MNTKDVSIFYQKAFEYAVRGYSVMPLRRNKMPLLSHWKELQESPADEKQIDKWWKLNPSANVGILTGKVSDITVIDIDTNGKNTVSLDIFPKTYTVITPSGGYHLYYKYNPAIKQGANAFPQFPHVDIRNDGGYVVAPPSFCDYIKNGKRTAAAYKIFSNFPIVDFPIELFQQTKQPQKDLSLPKLLKNFDMMQEGDGRNVALTKIVGKIMKMVEKSDWPTVGVSLAHAANKRFKKPLDDREVMTIFESIMVRESQKPHRRLNVDLITDDKGNPVMNEENLRRVVNADPVLSSCMRFNIFNGMPETNFQRSEFSTLQEDDISRMRMYLMQEYPFLIHIPQKMTEYTLMVVAREHNVSPPVQWLKSLQWDETPRLDTWLVSLAGVEDNAYHRAVGSNWMKGLVKRVVHPGCKFDFVLVLEGDQGIRKSTSLRILGGDWHVETTLTPDNKDFFMMFGGKMIVEFSEGETLSRSETKKLKAVITMQVDRYRVPFDRAPREFPRQCVFAMTTNEKEYLKDETGNRRWLPVECTKQLDTDWLEANREQLFAEAYHRVVTLKESIHEFPEEETRSQQERRQVRDPRVDTISSWYTLELTDLDRVNGITTQEAYFRAIHRGVPYPREMTKLDMIIIGSIFRNVLKLEKKRVKRDGILSWRYVPTDETQSIFAPDDQLTDNEKAIKDFTNA